ncbi:MAG: PBSX family phage terminase large subunit [Ruminococcus sp.]|nr:PBSX family phage terminase large subunit [Ruminococcus sp.]
MGRGVSSAVFKFKPFSRKQLQLLTWWQSESPVKDMDGIICDGAIRSGKTVAMSLSFVMWAMTSFNCVDFAICGKTVGSARRNVIKPLKRMLKGRGYKVTDHRSDNILTISRGDVSNDFHIFGGKDESSQDLIQGITLSGLLLDEAALMPRSFFDQATARCSVEGSKFWYNCNPAGPGHWFKQEVIDKREEKRLCYLHFTMDDNLSLSERIKARYRSQWSGVFYDRYIEGQWSAADGLIYDMFDRSRHVLAASPEFDDVPAYVTCDYGTLNPCVFLLWKRAKDRRWIVTKEYYYSGRDNKKLRTDEEYANDMLDFISGERINRIIVDPSAASFITALCKKGFKNAVSANNAVLDGIRLVGSLLVTDKIGFMSCCENTIREFGSYVWDSKAAQRGEDIPVKQFDHAMDAVRYFCNTVLAPGRKVGTSDLRKRYNI